MKRLFAFIAVLLLALPVQSNAGSEALTALKHCLGDIHSVSADFQQQLYASDGYLIQENSGSMLVAAPGRIRWLVENPMEQWVISDGSTLWLYDPDLEQVIIRPFDQNLGAAPALLLTGDTEQLDSAFLVDFAAADIEATDLDATDLEATDLEATDVDSQDSIHCHFRLRPRDDQSLYRELKLSLQDGLPLSITIIDSLDQRTRIDFENAVLNGAVDERLFSFEPPPGVDIIHDD